MQNIQSIIFDLGGVILDISLDKTKEAFRQLGIEDFEKMYSFEEANLLFQKLEEGKLNEMEFYEAFRISSQTTIPDDAIKNAWNALLLQFRKGSLAELEMLKKKYKIYLLSNTNLVHRKAFDAIFETQVGKKSLSDYFDAAYYSYEIGHRKPGAEAYEYVLKKNNLIAAETLFIDDALPNIEAAQKAGLQVLHLKDNMKIEDLHL